MEHLIRPVAKKDNQRLAGIIREVFMEHDAPREGTVYSDPTTDSLFELFLVPKSVLWVAVINNEPIGCCGIYPSEGLPGDCAELVKFYLVSRCQGQRNWKGINAKMHQFSYRIRI